MATTRGRPIDVLAWAAIALLAVYFLFLGGASTFQASPQARVLSHLLTFVAMVATLAAAVSGRLSLRSPLARPGALWVAATVVGAVFSIRPEASREAIALLLLGVPVYFLIRHVFWTPTLRPRVEWLLIATTTTFLLAYLVQVLMQWRLWWSAVGPSVPPLRPGDVGLTLGTVNGVSLYIELLVPIAVWLSWTRWRSMPFSVGLALIGGIALVITGSRGAWLGSAAGMLALLALIALTERNSLGRSIGRVPVPARMLVVTLVVAAGLVLSPILVTRLAGGDAGRIELWTAAWSIFLDHPLLGAGPGSWQGLRALEPITSGNLVVLAAAHNSVLQILAETGVVGLVAAAVLAGAVVRAAVSSIASAADTATRRLRQIVLASLVAAAVHSLVDTQFHLPAVVVLTMVLVAQFDPPQSADHSTVGSANALPLVAAGLAVVVGAGLLAPVDAAMLRADQGNRALDRDRPGEAATHYDAAIALHDLPVYRVGLAVARSRLDDPAGAAADLERAAAGEPYTFIVAQHAFASFAAGEPGEAADLADWVLSRGTYDPTATLMAAVVHWELDEQRKATAALTDVIHAVPTLVYSTRPEALFDQATWDSARSGALDRIAEVEPGWAAALALQAGLTDRAEALLAAVPAGPEREMLDLLRRAVVEHATDVDRARAILQAAPSSQSLLRLHWMIGFAIGSQAELDLVAAISGPLYFAVPEPPMEIVLEGRPDAEYSLRLARWPMSASSRLGPRRPYLAGVPTIEPVFRPN